VDDPAMPIEPFVFVVLALASYRLTLVLAGIDTLMADFTKRVVASAYLVDGCNDPTMDRCHEMMPRYKGTLGFLHRKLVDLVSCPYCLGFWVGLVMLCVVISQWPWDLGWDGWMTALGIAGVQAFLTSIDGR
jgi:hypothetical protein